MLIKILVKENNLDVFHFLVLLLLHQKLEVIQPHQTKVHQ